MFSAGMPPATGQNQGASEAQRDAFYAALDEQRAVNADAEGVSDEMAVTQQDQQDHETTFRQAEADARQSESLYDQGKRALEDLKNQVDDGWRAAQRFAESINDKQEQADQKARLASEQCFRWFTDWLLISISNTNKNMGEILVHIFSIMKKMHAAENGLGASVSPLELGAVAAVTSAPIETWHAYLQEVEAIEGEWNKYNDEVARLGEQQGRVAERASEVEEDGQDEARFSRTANFEEKLSDDLRAELDAQRSRLSGYRQQLADISARMDDIRQDANADPTDAS